MKKALLFSVCLLVTGCKSMENERNKNDDYLNQFQQSINEFNQYLSPYEIIASQKKQFTAKEKNEVEIVSEYFVWTILRPLPYVPKTTQADTIKNYEARLASIQDHFSQSHYLIENPSDEN